MAIIDQYRTNLRDFFDAGTCKIIGPVIRMKSGLIWQTGCYKRRKKWKNLLNYRTIYTGICGLLL